MRTQLTFHKPSASQRIWSEWNLSHALIVSLCRQCRLHIEVLSTKCHPCKNKNLIQTLFPLKRFINVDTSEFFLCPILTENLRVYLFNTILSEKRIVYDITALHIILSIQFVKVICYSSSLRSVSNFNQRRTQWKSNLPRYNCSSVTALLWNLKINLSISNTNKYKSLLEQNHSSSFFGNQK